MRTWIPMPLRRHIVLLVEWLQLANALHRWRAEWLALVAVSLAAAATVTIFSSRLIATVILLADYWVLTAVVAAVYAASSVARRRRRIQELHLQSWLIAAPIPQASVRASHTIRTLLPIFAQFLGTVLFIWLVDWNGKVIAAIAAGVAAGVIVGWRGSTRSQARTPASHYVRWKRTGADALSAWPISQGLAWSRPENARYLLVIALFAVPGGSSAIMGLSIVALYFIGSYLVVLLSALISVAKAASAWLRSTPMALSEFVWLLSRRALVHQVLGTGVAVAFLSLLGAPLVPTLQIAALWLGLAISVSGCALIDCYRGRSPAMKVAVCFVAWSALLTVMHLRSAERT